MSKENILLTLIFIFCLILIRPSLMIRRIMRNEITFITFLPRLIRGRSRNEKVNNKKKLYMKLIYIIIRVTRYIVIANLV